MSKSIDESKIVAANYIISFYSQVATLTHHYSNYENIMLELDQAGKDYPPETKDTVKTSIQNLRYYIIQTHISYNSIMKGINKTSDEKLKTIYEKIKSEFIINRGDVEKYTICLNDLLVSTVMKNLLQTSKDLFSKIYPDQQKTTQDKNDKSPT